MNIVKINQKEVKFKNFWKPGDQIICTRIFRRSNNECFLCGHTPIEWHHVLLNTISNEIVDVEFSCVIDMKKILEKSGSDQKILFFPKYIEDATHLNSQYAGTAAILEFNANTQVVAQMLSKPQDLNHQQVKLILDYTSKFEKGSEYDLFSKALDIYINRRYFIYDSLEDHQKAGNVEETVEIHIRKEWDQVQNDEEEYQKNRYFSSCDHGEYET